MIELGMGEVRQIERFQTGNSIPADQVLNLVLSDTHGPDGITRLYKALKRLGHSAATILKNDDEVRPILKRELGDEMSDDESDTSTASSVEENPRSSASSRNNMEVAKEVNNNKPMNEESSQVEKREAEEKDDADPGGGRYGQLGLLLLLLGCSLIIFAINRRRLFRSS